MKSGEKIKSHTIDPTEISSQLYNEFVNIHSVSYWFEADVWSKFQNFYEAKLDSFKNRCSSCGKSDVVEDDIIHCDHCLTNFHHSCGKVKKTSKKRHQWFCNPCKMDFKSCVDTNGMDRSYGSTVLSPHLQLSAEFNININIKNFLRRFSLLLLTTSILWRGGGGGGGGQTIDQLR